MDLFFFMFDFQTSASAEIELKNHVLLVYLIDDNRQLKIAFKVAGSPVNPVAVLIDDLFWDRVNEQAEHKSSIDPTVEVIVDVINRILGSLEDQQRVVFTAAFEDLVTDYNDGRNALGVYLAYINPFIRKHMNVH